MPPVPLRGRLRQALRQHRALILLSDLDGTLAPIRDRPQDARLPPRTHRALARLARHPRARVGFLSGRSLRDLRRLVGLPSAVCAGSHGLEIACGTAHFRHPRAVDAARLLRRVSRELARRTARLGGIVVETKSLAVAVHFRRADRAAVPRLRAIVREVTGRVPTLEVLAGKKVLEVRPRVGWGKGEAAALLRSVLAESLGRASPVTLYLGDDATDEPAFRALRGKAFCVVVGRRRSRAPYRLRGPAAVGDLLAWLAEVLTGC
jgi:trehalose-phosphatase